jgi:hypothetical protein
MAKMNTPEAADSEEAEAAEAGETAAAGTDGAGKEGELSVLTFFAFSLGGCSLRLVVDSYGSSLSLFFFFLIGFSCSTAAAPSFSMFDSELHASSSCSPSC